MNRDFIKVSVVIEATCGDAHVRIPVTPQVINVGNVEKEFETLRSRVDGVMHDTINYLHHQGPRIASHEEVAL